MKHNFYIILVFITALTSCSSTNNKIEIVYGEGYELDSCETDLVRVKNQEHLIRKYKTDIICAPIKELCMQYSSREKIKIQKDGSYTCEGNNNSEKAKEIAAMLAELSVIIWLLTL